MKIIEKRKEFIKHNNIIIKVNNFGEAFSFTRIFNSKNQFYNELSIGMNFFERIKYPPVYMIHIASTDNIYLTNDYNFWNKKKIIIHEFPTKNFINAFNKGLK